MTDSPTESIRSDIETYLRREFLADEGDIELTSDTPLISGGVLSSIGLVKLVSFLEERFEVRFAAHEISEEHLDTIEAITEAILAKRGN